MIVEIDNSITLFLNGFTGNYFFLDSLFFFLASVTPFVFVIFLLFLFINNRKKNGLFVVESLFAGLFSKYAVVEPLRHFFPRIRPFQVLEEVNLILPYKESFSMPSGHASFLFAISVVVYLHNKKAGIAVLAISFLSVLSRVICGTHYFLDIIAGALIGLVVAILTNEVMKKLNN
ncbi:MAG: phosphatase PAP2 family protein [Candidatus Pacebacteria bacterium]|nr:phosphatase PAP2 family protein [Candidatus Paceibacterota bacterium]